MSEFSKLKKATQQLTTFVTEKESIDLESLDFDTLRLLKALTDKECAQFLDKVVPKINSFMKKKEYVDPITGAYRFGDMKKKEIQTLSAECEIFLTSISSLKSKVDSCILMREKELQHLNTISSDLSSHTVESTVSLDREEKDTALAEQTLKRQKEEKEQQLLHDKAEKIRARKAEEAAVLNEAHEKINKQLIATLAILNNKCRGPAYVSELLSSKWSDSMICSADRESLLSFLLSVLDKILAYPDNQALRRLRIDHPIVHENVSRFSVGVALLCALGFQANIVFVGVSESTTPPPPAPSSAGWATAGSYLGDSQSKQQQIWQQHAPNPASIADASRSSTVLQIMHELLQQDHSNLCYDFEYLLRLCRFCSIVEVNGSSADSRVSILFQMCEPDPSNTDLWIAWFDDLTEMRRLIRASSI